MGVLTNEGLNGIFDKRQEVRVLSDRLMEEVRVWQNIDWDDEDRLMLASMELTALDFIRGLEAYKEARFPEVLNETGGRG